MRDQLLGYLLNALEPDEKRDLERRLSIDPELRRDLELLRRSLEPLDGSTSAFDPPQGLAQRTCDWISDLNDKTDPAIGAGPELRSTPDRTKTPEPKTPDLKKVEQFKSLEAVRKRYAATTAEVGIVAPGRRWRMADVAVTAGVAVAASLLFFPIVASMRHQTRITACRDKMHRVGMSVIDYSRVHGDLFPEVPDHGPLGHAGIYAPRLKQAKYIVDVDDVVCPGQSRASIDHIPTIDELEHADSAALVNLTATMGGSYGYALGYVEHGDYHFVRNRNRPNFALLADTPQDHALGSLNHGCGGQNVFFEDGHASFLSCCRRRELGDDLYSNREGFVGAGIGPDDVVIGASAAAPLFKAVPTELSTQLLQPVSTRN